MDNNTDVLKGYFADDGNVRDTVNKVASLTLGQLRLLDTGEKPRIKIFADDVIKFEEFDKEICENMTYLELMCILDNSQYDRNYNFAYPNTEIHMGSVENFLFYTFALATYFYVACDQSTIIRKFMALPLYRMYEVFGIAGLWPNFIKRYKNIKKITDDEFEGKDLNVKDILDACRDVVSKPWYPGSMLPPDYISNIRNAYYLEAWVLIKSLLLIYPQKDNADEVKERYRLCTDDDDGYDDIYYGDEDPICYEE